MALVLKRDLDQPLSLKELDEVWVRGRPTFVGLVVMATVLVFIHREFGGRAPPMLLYPWLAYMTAGIAIVLGMIIAYFIEPLRTRITGRFWRNSINVVSFFFCSGVAISVWVLLPFADDLLRMLMIFLYMWFVAMVMLANADRITTVGAMAVLVSAALFTVTEGIPYGPVLAGFLFMAGVATFSMRRLIWQAADQAAYARAEAQQSADALQQALELVRAERDAKTRFIASASHDLQQPLAAAALYFDQILSSKTGAHRDHAEVGVKRALQSTQALLQVMLDHLRLEAGATPVRLSLVSLDEVIQEVVMEHMPAAQMAGFRLTAVRSRLEVTGDFQLLRRTLGNLVANAIRHARGSRIVIGARLRQGRTDLMVIDDGKGILATDVDRLFDDYSQGSDHGVRSPGGFGLGLASARRMAELLDSRLALDSRWQRGSAFVVTIPGGTRIQTEEAACKAA